MTGKQKQQIIIVEIIGPALLWIKKREVQSWLQLHFGKTVEAEMEALLGVLLYLAGILGHRSMSGRQLYFSSFKGHCGIVNKPVESSFAGKTGFFSTSLISSLKIAPISPC